MLLEHCSRLYMYGGAGAAYGHWADGLFMLIWLVMAGRFGMFVTILELILFGGEEKHTGCDDVRGFTEFSPHGNALEPSGLGTFVAQLLYEYPVYSPSSNGGCMKPPSWAPYPPVWFRSRFLHFARRFLNHTYNRWKEAYIIYKTTNKMSLRQTIAW